MLLLVNVYLNPFEIEDVPFYFYFTHKCYLKS